MSLKLLATKQFSANKLLCSEITTKEFAYSQHSAAQSKKCVLPLFLLNSSSSTFLSSFLRQTNHSCMTWDISAYTSKSKIRLLTFTQKKTKRKFAASSVEEVKFLVACCAELTSQITPTKKQPKVLISTEFQWKAKET